MIYECYKCQKQLCSNCVENVGDDDIRLCQTCILELKDGYLCRYCDGPLDNQWSINGGFNMVCQECLKGDDCFERHVSKIKPQQGQKQVFPQYLIIYM
jgi:hypothetical protein